MPPPEHTSKPAISAEDIRAMVAALPYDLRGLRDRAILLVGHAAGLRRSEIVSLELNSKSANRITLSASSATITLTEKTHVRSKSPAAPTRKPAPFRPSKNGCTLRKSTQARSLSEPRATANAR